MPLDSFVKIEGEDVEGECTVKGHEKQLQLESFSFGASNSGSRHSATGGGVGKGSVMDLMCSMNMDKASPLLMKACAAGDHFDKATLFARKAGGDEPVTYMEIEMKDILISSFQTGASTGAETSMVNFSLNFATISFIYRPQKADGTPDADVTQGWDIAKGEKL